MRIVVLTQLRQQSLDPLSILARHRSHQHQRQKIHHVLIGRNTDLRDQYGSAPQTIEEGLLKRQALFGQHDAVPSIGLEATHQELPLRNSPIPIKVATCKMIEEVKMVKERLNGDGQTTFYTKNYFVTSLV